MGNVFLWVDEAIEKVVDLFDDEISRSPGISIRSTARQSVMEISVTVDGCEYATKVMFNEVYIRRDRLMSSCYQLIDKVEEEQQRSAVTDVTY